jgi:abhydrolase domain-containing protein 14
VVLFLHGASFTSKVWQETGIANDLAEAGIASVAVDLPGYGETPATDASPATVLANVIAAVDRGHGVVVVSPSMSGSFSLPLLASGPPAELVGFVPVAPVGINEFVAAVDTPVALPTLIVWGESDDVINPRQAKLLAKQFSNSEVMMIRGGGHAAYRDEPKRFSTALIEFVNGLPPS